MRTYAYLVTLLAAGLVLGATGPALADDTSGQEPSSHRSPREGRGANATEMKERHEALAAARNASLASFHENRTAALAAFHAANNATKASFLENKSRVQEECRALANSTGNATGQCIRDGLKPLIEKARAEHRAAREAFQAAMLAARTDAIQQFMEARAQIRAQHAASSSG